MLHGILRKIKVPLPTKYLLPKRVPNMVFLHDEGKTKFSGVYTKTCWRYLATSTSQKVNEQWCSKHDAIGAKWRLEWGLVIWGCTLALMSHCGNISCAGRGYLLNRLWTERANAYKSQIQAGSLFSELRPTQLKHISTTCNLLLILHASFFLKNIYLHHLHVTFLFQ